MCCLEVWREIGIEWQFSTILPLFCVKAVGRSTPSVYKFVCAGHAHAQIYDGFCLDFSVILSMISRLEA